jgi:hypothetical protein
LTRGKGKSKARDLDTDADDEHDDADDDEHDDDEHDDDEHGTPKYNKGILNKFQVYHTTYEYYRNSNFISFSRKYAGVNFLDYSDSSPGRKWRRLIPRSLRRK